MIVLGLQINHSRAQAHTAYYQGVLNHMSEANKIKIIGYFDEKPGYSENKMWAYKSHVSVQLVQTGKEVTGSSTFAASKAEARELAAEQAWIQLQTAMATGVQEGRG